MVGRIARLVFSLTMLILVRSACGEEDYARSPRRLAISADGKHISVASEDKRVRIWDAATGRLDQTLDIGLPGLSVAFSPDGKTLVAGTEGARPDSARLLRSRLCAWDISREQPRLLWDVQKFGLGAAIAFAPDGAWCVVASWYASLDFFDLKTGLLRRRWLEGGSNGLTDVGVTPDGNTVVTSGQAYRLWDMTVEPLPHAIEPLDVITNELAEKSERFVRAKLTGSVTTEVASDGKWSVALGAFDDGRGRDVNLGQIDLVTGKLMGVLARGIEDVTCISLAPDDKTLAIGFKSGEVKIWSVAEKRQEASYAFNQLDGIRSLAFFPEGSRLAVTGRGGAKVVIIDVTIGGSFVHSGRKNELKTIEATKMAADGSSRANPMYWPSNQY